MIYQELAGLGLSIKPPPSAANRAGEDAAYKFLRSLGSFSKLPEDELKTLANSSRFASVDSGQYIAAEGDEKSRYGFIVVSGRLAMIKTSINGKELVVELLPPGDIFGLILTLALEQLPAQLSARAQSNSKVLWVPVGALTSILNAHPTIYKDFVAHLSESLQSSYRMSRGLAHDRVEVRIAAILSNLALKFARVLPASQDYTIDITRQQLADLTGTTTESAIRITRAMQHSRLIDIERPGTVRVLDLKALQGIAEE